MVELPLPVGLLADAPALLSSIAVYGRVLEPLPITAASNLSLEVVPSRVRPDGTMRLRLSLGARHAAQSAESWRCRWAGWQGPLAQLLHCQRDQ